MLLNINEHIVSYPKDYRIDNERFTALLNALKKNGIVDCKSNANNASTEDYYVIDIERFDKWSRSGFYRYIEKYIIPLVECGTAILNTVASMK